MARSKVIPKDPRERARLVRDAARGKVRVGNDARLALLAETFKRNRAKYDARRQVVRDLAARIRRGEKPRAPVDLLDAAHRWLKYREAYNKERRVARAAAKEGRREASKTPASRRTDAIVGRALAGANRARRVRKRPATPDR